jgi:aspartate aminotransferase
MKLSRIASKWQESPIRKFHPLAEKAKADGKKIYHLNIGQPDIATPKEYFDAVREFSAQTLSYAPSPGLPVLIDAVRNYYAKIGVELDEGDILITAGGSEALLITLLTVMDEGAEILVPEPYYSNYANFASSTGGKICPVPTDPENGYRYADRELLEAHITENTRALLLNNPGNPTGVLLTEEEMKVIAQVAKDHDLYLITDEVYREFCYVDGVEIPTFGRVAGLEENLIIIDSVSKRFSACGARIGCLITKNREMQQAILKFCQSRLSVATLDQIGAAALYSVGDDFYKECNAEYRRRRDTVVEGLSKIPCVKFEKPNGAFYLMVSLPVDDTDKFQRWLLEEFDNKGETVMFAPGAAFYATPGKGQNEVRIAYVLNCEDLTRAIELLGIALARYQKEQM